MVGAPTASAGTAPAAGAPAAFGATEEISATAEVNLPPYRVDDEDEEEEEERTQILNTSIIAASLPESQSFAPPPNPMFTPPRPEEIAPRKVGIAVRSEGAAPSAQPRAPGGAATGGTPRPSAMHPSMANPQRPGTAPAARPSSGGTTPGGTPRPSNPGTNPRGRTGMQSALRPAQTAATGAPGRTAAAPGPAAAPASTAPSRPSAEPDLFAPSPRRTTSLPSMPAVGGGQTPGRRPATRSGLTPSGAKRPDSRSGPAPRRTPHEEFPRTSSGTGTPVARTFSASHPAFDAVKIAGEAEKEAANRAKGLQPQVEILASSPGSSAPVQPSGAAAIAQQAPTRPPEADKRPAVVPVRSAAKDAVETPVPKGLYYLAGAMALFLMFGIGLITRGPTEAKVMINATPSESVVITVGGRQVQSGEQLSFPPGEYELVATAKGYKRYTQRITVFEDAPDSTYPIVLEPEETVDIVPAVPTVTGAKFSLQFTSATPEVEVWVDGVSVGITPKAAVSLDIGRSYRYEARAQGYEPVEGVIGSYGEPQLAVPLNMRKAGANPGPSGRGKLILSSQPAGAEIHINGVPTGRRTPVTAAAPIEIGAGRHVLQFKLAGKSSEPQRVTLGVGQAVMLDNVAVDRE